MSLRFARFSMFGLLAVVAPHALAGCMDPVDGAAEDEAADEQSTSDQLTRDPHLVINLESPTCNSGWPGSRFCQWSFTSATDIIPGTLSVQITGRNGELGHAATQTGPRTVDFIATVQEGDVFQPGKNSTTYAVLWLRQ